ncbi:MAG: hypothetical protein H6711_09600 [Myxococcales bacterium]|nr:hypothetical protein [Myxococcales bacterium]
MDSGKLVKIEQLPVQGTYDQDQILAVLSRIACTPGLLDRLIRCADRMPELERQLGHFEDRCRSTVSRCESLELIAGAYLCPEQVSFSRRTRDEFSNRSQVKLHKVEQDFGGDFVNSFPVPPGKKIRLTHAPRPGYTPDHIRIDLNIAGGGNNYSDFTVQFYVVPGGVNSELGLEIGNEYDGNLFLNKDGSQIKVNFPDYRGMPLDIGTMERLAVVISNNGPANNLDSAHVNIFYDNNRFYELCKERCGCDLKRGAV